MRGVQTTNEKRKCLPRYMQYSHNTGFPLHAATHKKLTHSSNTNNTTTIIQTLITEKNHEYITYVVDVKPSKALTHGCNPIHSTQRNSGNQAIRVLGNDLCARAPPIPSIYIY